MRKANGIPGFAVPLTKRETTLGSTPIEDANAFWLMPVSARYVARSLIGLTLHIVQYAVKGNVARHALAYGATTNP